MKIKFLSIEKLTALKKTLNTGGWLAMAILIFVAGVAALSGLGLPKQLRLLVVQSGSMEPAIRTGSLVLVTPVGEIISPAGENLKDIKVGEVITFKKNNNPNILVTHRIDSITEANNQTLIETKGDANNAPDMDKIRSENVVGKVLFAIPFLGFPVAFAKTVPGYLLMIIIPALAIVLSEIWAIKGEIEKYYAKKFAAPLFNSQKPKARRFFKRLGKSLATFLIFFSVSLIVLGGTRGLFSDQEKIEGNSVSTWVGGNNGGENGNGNGGGSENQITICHQTRSGTNPWEELTIPQSAWPAHEQHGDTLGPCTQALGLNSLDGGNNENQIVVCHQTGSETNPWEEIVIAENAWPAHEQHGDILGFCSPPAGGSTLTSTTDSGDTGREENPSPTPTPSPGEDNGGQNNDTGNQILE